MSAFLDFFRAAFPWLAIGLLLAIYFGICARRKKDDQKHENYGLIGMCIGLCVGVSLQHVVGSIGTGISLGLLAGLVIGTLIEKKD